MPSRLCLSLAAALAIAACADSATRDAGDGAGTSPQDSVATSRELQASLADESGPGGQVYSYRGLYAGMTRSQLERSTVPATPGQAQPCQPSIKPPGEMSCVYQAVLGPDSAHVRVEARYGGDRIDSAQLAKEVTVTRELPIDVDGVRVASELSDTFQKQTALLDRRDATYGHHQAHVQIGTVNGSNKNYIEMTVMPRLGREELTVKMSRAGAPPGPQPAQPHGGPAHRASILQKLTPHSKKR